MDHGNGIDQNAEKFKDYLLPTLVDVAGVENENTDLWKELLRIVFYGILPEGDSLFSAYKYGVKHGVQVTAKFWIAKKNHLSAVLIRQVLQGHVK